MMDIDKSIDEVKKLSTLNEANIYYDRIYFGSNECLEELFNNFSVEDKDVLTVLASSDQLFYSYDRGARSVDTFDINVLTKYYYYIRKWSIQYLNCYYTDEENIINSHSFIKELLKLVECSSEEEKEAYIFWSNYIRRVSSYENQFLYFYVESMKYNEIKNLSTIKNRINNKLNFTNQDITSKIDKSHKYDVIILSNILEYYGESIMHMSNCRDNLYSILNDDGIVVCSHIMDQEGDNNLEKHIFSKKFDSFEFPKYSRDYILGGEVSSGYCYKKRMSTKNS